jgi:hypothetical protein
VPEPANEPDHDSPFRVIEGGARTRDLILAEQLGFNRPRKIMGIDQARYRRARALRRYTAYSGRPGTEYLLNGKR